MGDGHGNTNEFFSIHLHLSLPLGYPIFLPLVLYLFTCSLKHLYHICFVVCLAFRLYTHTLSYTSWLVSRLVG
ncbi:hypothetical protein F5X96DRAFT_630816 [Biscogniauxia mediterranea]|nr:hypothetical protein F5X96DRAFT_630816 [Biscogniauxia mediterranea]